MEIRNSIAEFGRRTFHRSLSTWIRATINQVARVKRALAIRSLIAWYLDCIEDWPLANYLAAWGLLARRPLMIHSRLLHWVSGVRVQYKHLLQRNLGAQCRRRCHFQMWHADKQAGELRPRCIRMSSLRLITSSHKSGSLLPLVTRTDRNN